MGYFKRKAESMGEKFEEVQRAPPVAPQDLLQALPQASAGSLDNDSDIDVERLCLEAEHVSLHAERAALLKQLMALSAVFCFCFQIMANACVYTDAECFKCSQFGEKQCTDIANQFLPCYWNAGFCNEMRGCCNDKDSCVNVNLGGHPQYKCVATESSTANVESMLRGALQSADTADLMSNESSAPVNELDANGTLPLSTGALLMAASADCASFCQYSPSSVWQYMSDCTGCSGSGSSSSPAETGTPSSVSGSCADYCKHIPSGSWKDVPSCEQCDGSDAADRRQEIHDSAAAGRMQGIYWLAALAFGMLYQ